MTAEARSVDSISRFYKVRGLPEIIYLVPNSKGKSSIKFRGDRDYSNVIKWVEKLLLLNGGKLLLNDDDEPTIETED